MNHPVYDFFQVLTEGGFITISDGKQYFTDRVENTHVNARPIPMRIQLNLDETEKKMQFVDLLKEYKGSVTQVHEFLEHIERWQGNIAKYSKDAEARIVVNVPDAEPMRYPRPKPPSILPSNEEKHESGQEIVRDVKQQLIELVDILEKKNYASTAGYKHDDICNI